MKIASVTFSPLKENVGGAVIPAIAFKQWCDYFNRSFNKFESFKDIDCEVVGIIPENIKPIEHDFVSSDMLITSNISVLNDYDAIFFNTPPIYVDWFDPDIIKKPFIIMIHGELDYQLYGRELILSFLEHPKCVGQAHIDPNRDDGFFWHPCTQPGKLINRTIQNRTGAGMVYAARIRNWLNPDLFLNITNQLSDIIGVSTMMGPIAGKHVNRIRKLAARSKTNLNLGAFSQNTFFNLNRKIYSLYWDVAGNQHKPLQFNRLSLSGYEALKNGFMPIIQKGTAPKGLEGKLIEIDTLNFNSSKFRTQLVDYFFEPHEWWIKINYEIRYGDRQNFTENKVRDQVAKIIDALIGGFKLCQK